MSWATQPAFWIQTDTPNDRAERHFGLEWSRAYSFAAPNGSEAAAEPADVVCGLLTRVRPARPAECLSVLRVEGSNTPEMITRLTGLICHREGTAGQK